MKHRWCSNAVLWRKRHKTFDRLRLSLPQRRRSCAADRPRTPTPDRSSNTLERLHAELGAQILENKAEAIKLSGKMLHVEAVIKMLDPAFNLRRIAVKRRQPNPWFKRGTVYRRAVDALRTATEPLTADGGARLGRRQYKDSRQGRSGGPNRDHQIRRCGIMMGRASSGRMRAVRPAGG